MGEELPCLTGPNLNAHSKPLACVGKVSIDQNLVKQTNICRWLQGLLNDLTNAHTHTQTHTHTHISGTHSVRLFADGMETSRSCYDMH